MTGMFLWIDGARTPWTPEIRMATKPLFQPGRILMTPGAVAAIQRHKTTPSALVIRHLTGDGGTLDAFDTKQNKLALNPRDPKRILSSYALSDDDTVWVITEWDRSVTTLLLPSEY